MCSLPKATVQAALGGLPLAQNIVEKPIGDYISSATAFAVLIFAPFGVLLTATVGRPLAERLRQYEQQQQQSDGLGQGHTQVANESSPLSPVGVTDSETVHSSEHVHEFEHDAVDIDHDVSQSVASTDNDHGVSVQSPSAKSGRVHAHVRASSRAGDL